MKGGGGVEVTEGGIVEYCQYTGAPPPGYDIGCTFIIHIMHNKTYCNIILLFTSV